MSLSLCAFLSKMHRFGSFQRLCNSLNMTPSLFNVWSSDDVNGWNILRKTRTDIATCGFSKWGVFTESSCTIKGAFPDDSGEYWCEAGGGKRSGSVKVTITGGPVILESPALPVIEGKTVTLSCRNKMAFTNLTADFYKDGRLKISSSTGEMTIHSVSRCDEGLYKCTISDVGESAENWLAVRELHSETPPPSDHMFIIFRNIFPVVLMALLLLLLGLFHCGKLR
ncbi:hypothetical protein L3Q82_016482, partial [Scortum barcoo]